MSLYLNGKKYKNGTVVRANPVEEATGTLEKIGIGSDVYDIAGSGGGGNALIMDAQIYSEDEQVVGIWTDGKPLYQKTITLTSKQAQIDISGLNIDTYVKSEGVYRMGDYVFEMPRLADSTASYASYLTTYYADVDSGLIAFLWGSNVSSIDELHITLQYTKTTDTAGSGGYQAYGFSPVIYSTEEREIGVWTDNKPLYQKTFIDTVSLSSSGWTTTSNSITDCESLVKCETVRNGVSGQADGTILTSCEARLNDNIIEFFNPRNVSLTITEYTVQYTKTTDVAGSGSYNTLGVPTVHYTTDEQVIGTWIDGKPLYRKTVIKSGTISQRETVSLGIANVENIFLVSDASNVNNGQTPLPLVTGTDNSNNTGGFFDIQQSDTSFLFRIGSGMVGYVENAIITVQYTKTTD